MTEIGFNALSTRLGNKMPKTGAYTATIRTAGHELVVLWMGDVDACGEYGVMGGLREEEISPIWSFATSKWVKQASG